MRGEFLDLGHGDSAAHGHRRIEVHPAQDDGQGGPDGAGDHHRHSVRRPGLRPTGLEASEMDRGAERIRPIAERSAISRRRRGGRHGTPRLVGFPRAYCAMAVGTGADRSPSLAGAGPAAVRRTR